MVDEAHRLLRGDGAMIDQFDPETQTLEWAYDAGIPEAQRQAVKLTSLHLGEGVSGKAVAERRVVRVGDYLAAEDFVHDDLANSLATGADLRDLIAAPIIGEAGPLGAIEVFSRRPNAFDAIDEAVLGGLADQAAIAITNARLIEELEKSRRAVARRADTERSLRDITARIAALREPDVILDRVVEEAARLLGTDGAHLTRMSDDGTYLVPVVVAGGADFTTQAWLLGMRFPLGGGINGLAAQSGEPVSTFDYLVDPRIPHNPDDTEVAGRLALRGMAAAPLRAPGGEVIGTLAVSSMEPRAFQPEELDLLQGLADQAAIAITNTNLLTRLATSEERYRYLVENAPDLVWSIDGEGRFTFLSDAVERLTGRSGGRGTSASTSARWSTARRAMSPSTTSPSGMTTGSQEIRGRVNVEGPDGEPVPAEFIATARLDEDGRFAGANGSVRDMRERDRLERGLRESEIRFRQLVQTSPDVIYRSDADGRFLFIAEGVEALFGWTGGRGVGLTFADLTAEESLPEALANFEQQHARARRRPPLPLHAPPSRRVDLPGRDHLGLRLGGRRLRRRPGDGPRRRRAGAAGPRAGRVRGALSVPGRELAGRRLRDRPGRHVHLPLGGHRAADRVHRRRAHAPALLDRRRRDRRPASRRTAGRSSSPTRPASRSPSWSSSARTTARRHVEVHAIGIIADDGSFAGIHGSTRDISERERLQRELRSSEERYRYLVSSSPDLVWVTDAEGQLVFVSEAAESILGTPAAELIGRPYWDVFAESARREAEVRFKWLSRHPTSVHRSRLPFRHADGHDVLVEINGIGMVEDGRFAGAHGAARDVSDRDRLERGLRQQAGELAAGEERAHLARELHDSVTQALFSMTLVSRSVELLLDRDPEAARTQLTQLRELQREALAEMRALIFELRPGNLEQDGLVRAIKTHTASLQGRIGLPVVVESSLDERLPLPVEETLYRIAQEALHNVVKHAGAHEVRLEIRRTPNAVRLRITDDGKGFDPSQVPDGHLGLAGMQARAARIGGTFSCRSEIGKGTTIEVVVEDPEHAVPDARLGEMPSGSIRDR